MQLLILTSGALLSHIVANGLSIAVLPNRRHEVAIRPKLTAPQLLFDVRATRADLACGETLDQFDYFSGAVGGGGLDEEVDMIAVAANFQKEQLVAVSNIQADFFEHRIYRRVKDDPPIPGGADQMV